MKKTFKVSPKTVTAAITLDERFDFEFPDKEFEIWGNGEYAKCTVVDDKVVDENEVEYTIAMEYPENYWQLEKFLLRGIDEYMHELTDGSDYSFDAIVEEGNPKYFYGSDDMYTYTATVTVYAIEPSVNESDYLVESFYEDNFRGLADSEEVEDLDSAIDVAHEYIENGGSVRITNLTTGESQGFTYDEYFDIGEDGLPNSDFAESPFDRSLLACNNINSATSITASAWKSPGGKKYGKQTRRFPGKYLFTRKELKQMVDNGDARYIGGNLDEIDSYDVIGFSWNETNGYKSGILVEDRNTGELLVGNTASATIAHF